MAKRGMGRGLAAILPETPAEESELRELPVQSIRRNPRQPRTRFGPDSIKTLAASLAAGLLAFDFLHFVLSRTAMLDVFVVFFGLVSFLCLLYDDDGAYAGRPVSRNLLHRLLERPWLLGAGIAGGAAVACKWSGGYLLGAVAVLAFLRGSAQADDGSHRYRRTAREHGLVLLIALGLIPAVLYVVSYAGRLHGAAPGRSRSDDSGRPRRAAGK